MHRIVAIVAVLALEAITAGASIRSARAATPAAGADSRRSHAQRDGWPDTPAGTMARRWVAAFSKGESAMRACLSDHLAPEALAKRGLDARMESYRGLREKLGELMLVKIGTSKPTEVVATLATSELTEREFTFEVQPRPPHKLVRVAFRDPRAAGHGGRFSH